MDRSMEAAMLAELGDTRVTFQRSSEIMAKARSEART